MIDILTNINDRYIIVLFWLIFTTPDDPRDEIYRMLYSKKNIEPIDIISLIQTGRLELLKRLLYIKEIELKDNIYLFNAIRSDQKDIVNYLLSMGLEPDEENMKLLRDYDY